MKAKGGRRPAGAPAPPFSPEGLFDRWKVFTFEAFRAAYAPTRASAHATTKLLGQHVGAGHLVRLRRGLFAVPDWFDPHVVASLLTPDAVLAYDGALSFHRLSEVGPRVSILSFDRCRAFEARGVAFQAVRPAQSLKRSRALVDEVEVRTEGGRTLRVTSKERTLVDALDRLEHFSSVFELVPAFHSAGPLRVGAMVRYAERLRHPLAAARLGVVLEALGMCSQWQRRRLEALAPRTPVYFDQGTRQEQHVFDRRWQLLIPLWLPNALRGQGDLRPERDESQQRRSPLSQRSPRLTLAGESPSVRR